MNNRGQILSILYIILVIALLIILSPIILKVGSYLLQISSDSIKNFPTVNNSTKDTSANLVDNTKRMLNGTIDFFVLLIIIVLLFSLFITLYLTQTEPVFLVFYVILAIVIVLVIPFIMSAGEAVFYNSNFLETATNLPMVTFLMENFSIIILIILIIGGIIIYGKNR